MILFFTVFSTKMYLKFQKFKLNLNIDIEIFNYSIFSETGKYIILQYSHFFPEKNPGSSIYKAAVFQISEKRVSDIRSKNVQNYSDFLLTTKYICISAYYN